MSEPMNDTSSEGQVSQVIEVDSNLDDNDSAYDGSVGNASDIGSVASNVFNYIYENGRRYHSYREGEYLLPNDDLEQDRLDLSHHIYRLLLGGALHLAPLENPLRILDIGTGTGIWAIDMADEYPGAEIIGNDLSPIQPAWVPPNCVFEIDDFEREWEYSRPFDFIHGRELEGFVRDYDRLFAQALQHLRPNGWLEMASFQVQSYSDDGTHRKAEYLERMNDALYAASRAFGKDMASISSWKARMRKAGFQNVREETYKLPLSPWPKDPRLKEVGHYHQINMLYALGAYTYALLTRALGWKKEEIEALLIGVRKELKDPNIHVYSKAWFVYGQKPGNGPGTVPFTS
ncbi:hypothetical protein ASPZODRAFT_128840 [Penicilliopsis zonata CBS 506.65]|uniref:Methyltransferase domain-containing protein n=1 Tax=Penicilliopsis zonata CBS 506.65 TaxID=1073090 RepID=A0A1L9SSP6_9EURO|nr:hypothetical protein ASPZODRAFT_128840 [Penicilliopsis zonata CBS 506.65]OJJ50215.1 hypothetical protein ASPZODRAFT_128840 [Penicilliopsis zonata CBS 506.65]